jgi:predicted metal-binding membrane protein
VSPRLSDGRVLVAGLAALAFIAVVSWGVSPYGRYLDHAYEPATVAGQAGAIAVYVAGWLLMTAAMMLPTATGVVRAFERVTNARPNRTRLRLELVAGFLLVWLAVGYTFRAADILVHAGVASWGWLADRPALVGAASLALAGAYQFSALKRRCLTVCRTPRSFIYRGWTGARPHADALRIGMRYGRSCAGCCWALMLVMFGVGATNLAWMLALAAVMAAERFAPERLRARLEPATGVVLLATAAAVAAPELLG